MRQGRYRLKVTVYLCHSVVYCTEGRLLLRDCWPNRNYRGLGALLSSAALCPNLVDCHSRHVQ